MFDRTEPAGSIRAIESTAVKELPVDDWQENQSFGYERNLWEAGEAETDVKTR